MSIVGNVTNTLIEEKFEEDGITFGDGSITVTNDITAAEITATDDITAADRVTGDSLHGRVVRTKEVQIWKGDDEVQLTYSETSKELRCSRNLQCTIENRNGDDEDVAIDNMFFRIQDNEDAIESLEDAIESLKDDLSDTNQKIDDNQTGSLVFDSANLVVGGGALTVALYAVGRCEQIEKVTVPTGDTATLTAAKNYTNEKITAVNADIDDLEQTLNDVEQTLNDVEQTLTNVEYSEADNTTYFDGDVNVGDILLEGSENAKVTLSDGIELNGTQGKVKAKNFSVETRTAMEMVNDGIKVTVSDIETDDVGTKRLRVTDGDLIVVNGDINCNSVDSRLKVARLASSELIDSAITCESTLVVPEITGGTIQMNEIVAVQDVGVLNSGNLTAQGNGNIHGNLTVQGSELFMSSSSSSISANEIIFGSLREHTISELLAAVTSLSERVTLLEAATDYDQVDFFFDQF